MTEVVRETLLEGLRDGINPRAMARNLTDEIESLQKTRAEMLARTEVVQAYTASTIDRYREAGVSAVTQVERADASDSRVCPICEALDGRVTPMGEIETATFQFEPGEDDQPSLVRDSSALASGLSVCAVSCHRITTVLTLTTAATVSILFPIRL
jgi:SPP1 gp7 family putative phage head morphogenesis protein